MADYGHDPTGKTRLKVLRQRTDDCEETAVPFQAFVDAGFDVSFATEDGKSPECDKKMLEGVTQKLW